MYQYNNQEGNGDPIKLLEALKLVTSHTSEPRDFEQAFSQLRQGKSWYDDIGDIRVMDRTVAAGGDSHGNGHTSPVDQLIDLAMKFAKNRDIRARLEGYVGR